MTDSSPSVPAFRRVPNTGVIFVMTEAEKRGFHYGHPDWCNLGQGAPEAGSLSGAPERMTSVELDDTRSEYGPVAGSLELREAVADLYNRRFRRNHSSRYTAKNVAISSGGRAGLTRIAAALGNVNLGHFLPDYTAYEELLGLFRSFVSIPILLDAENGFYPDLDRIRHEIVGKGLGAILFSNPCNPTGAVLYGPELERWAETARDLGCALIVDEFYSQFLYDEARKLGKANSIASCVKDVNRDPVVIVDGLTKNWRYPGLRISWTVGPEEVIRSITSAGSFIDGGAAHPVQTAALRLLDDGVADREADAIYTHFSRKRRLMLEALTGMGIRPRFDPKGSFYCFPDLSNLPEPLSDGMSFFQEALERKVITVPGEFFDIDPGGRRSHIPCRLKNYVRLSYGPPEEEISEGLGRLRRMLEDHKAA